MAFLLNAIEGVDALHEPRPAFHSILQEIHRRPSLAADFWMYKKLPTIGKRAAGVYVETSHLIGKGFIEPLIDLGCKPSFIFLTRSKRAIANSMYALGDIPGRTKNGMKYYLEPKDARFAILPKKLASLASDYQLCFWHAHEMEARQFYYKDFASKAGLSTAWISTEELNEWDAFKKLANQLEIILSESDQSQIKAMIGEVRNKRKQAKTRQLMSEAQMETEEAELLQAVQRASLPIGQ